MKIERSNILELIGSGKNKYHSCVITSYSIDLTFFEQLILPKLRSAGVTNINLFVDGTMLEKYLASHLASSTKKFKANYSITPVYISGAFHSKILFLSGKDKGYLSIGSGNITSSGLLYNDEIWSSFYTGKKRTNALPIFKDAWYYIQSLSRHSQGINLTKINWIPQYSVWIDNLSDINETEAVFKDEAFKLLYTKTGTSLYQAVISSLSQKPNIIKIIAPYYNSSGALIKKFQDSLNPSSVHCVVDTTCGILPVNFNSKDCEFSDWSDVINSNSSKSIQRLHAKMIQIEYDDKTLLILGSANATLEAFGVSKQGFMNDEAVITITSTNYRDFLKELGVKIPKKGTIDINTLQTETLDITDSLKGLIKLEYVELDGQSLNFKLDEAKAKTFLLKTFDSNNEELEALTVASVSQRIQISLSKIENILKVALFDVKTFERKSTFGLVQNMNSLKKSNPDERLAKLQGFEHLDIFSTLNYEMVLDFLEQERVLKENINSHLPVRSQSEIDEDDDEIISEADYNRNASLTLDEQETTENITSMVEEFLDVLKIRESEEEISSSLEEMAMEAGDDGIDENTTLQHTQKSISSKEGKRITRKIEKTINAVSNLIETRSKNNIPQDNRTLNALFIGFHILLHFWDETYSEELSVTKIYYRDLNSLAKLENKFGLKRLESQMNSSNNEVSYYIENSLLSSFQVFIENNKKEFRIVGHPSEPIIFDHSIISNKFIKDYENKNWIFDFLNSGLSKFMMALKSSDFNLEKDQKLKLIVLSNQLINKIIWSGKFNYWRELLLLNIYECIDLNDLSSNYIDLNEKLIGWDFCDRYLIFKRKLNNDNIKSKPVNPRLVNSIVFSKTMGFGMIRKTLKDAKIELYSPIISENLKQDEGGTYKTVYISKQLKVFN